MSGNTLTDSIAVSLSVNGVTYIPLSIDHYSNVVNHGITWEATFNGIIDPETWGDTDIWRMTVSSRIGAFPTWISPPLAGLVVHNSAGLSGPMTKISGMDMSGFLLSGLGRTMPDFVDTYAHQIALSIALRAGVTIVFDPSAIDWRVPRFIVQQDTFGSHITRIARDGGWDFRIQPNGDMFVFGNTYDSLFPQVIVSSHVERMHDKGNYVTKISVRKHSPQQTSFDLESDHTGLVSRDLGPDGLQPNSIQLFEQSTVGHFQYAAFYSGPGLTGQLVAYRALDPSAPPSGGTPNPGLPALSVVGAVMPAANNPNSHAAVARLHITGIPAQIYSYDPYFGLEYPPQNIAGHNRPNLKLVISTLWDIIGTVSGTLLAQLFVNANKSFDTLHRTIMFDPNILCAQTLNSDDFPKARYDSVQWSIPQNGAPTMQISGFVWPSFLG